MALVKILAVTESIQIGETVVRVDSVSRETVGLSFSPDPNGLSGEYQKKARINLIPGVVNIVVHMKPSQLGRAVLTIAAPREIEIKQLERLSND